MGKKKRNKKYRGKDSSITPDVIRIEAKQHSKIGNWWIDNKQSLLLRMLPVGILLIVASLLWLILAIFF